MVAIRLTSKEDLKELAEIYKTAYNSLNIGENWDSKSSLKLMQHLFEDQGDLFFIAEENGKILGGIVALVKPWWDGNHLTDGEIFIDPASQKKGIGTQLIKQMFTEALEKYQATSWDTFTHKVYEHPLKWYKSIGFKEIQHWTMIAGDIKEVLARLG